MKKKKKILYKDWVISWLSEKKNYVKESTYANYSNIVYNHLIPDLGNYRIGDINNKILQDLILNKYRVGRLDNNGGLSDKTIRDISTIMKLSLKSAIKNNIIDYIDLDFYYPKMELVNKIYIFSKNEQKKIIDYVMNNLNVKNIGILITLYSGIRIGELCALKWKDINFKKNILTVNKTIQRIYLKENNKSKIIITNPKTKNAYRDIPINSEFANLLKQFKTSNDNYIFSNTLRWVEPRTYRKYYDRLIKNIGVSKNTFHSLRHTFATLCVIDKQ